MPNFRLKQFKGLAQHVAFEELSPEYCHNLQDLDVDNPLGALSKRGGFTKKYSDAFTDIISAYEYEYPTSGDVILLFNDNGTLKYYTDGAGLASLTLPTGSTLAANFRNQYFGYKDRIIITTGNGATNHVLGFHYVKRVNASNTGLFGNVVQSTSYKLVPNQMIFPEGQFSEVYNVAQIGTNYYFSFIGSRYIEIRNSSFQLVERRIAVDGTNADTNVALAADATYLYVGNSDGIYKINPDGWVTEDSNLTLPGIVGVAVDADYVFVTTGANITRLDVDDFTTLTTEANAITFKDLVCEPSTGGAVYATSGTVVERYLKTDIVDGNHTHTVTPSIGTIENMVYDNTNDYVMICADIGATASVRRLSDADLTTIDTNTISNAQLRTFLPDGSVIEENYGSVYPFNSSTPTYPTLMSMAVDSVDVGGSLGAGTYFYKFSLVDTDGQESILSDPIVAHVSASEDVDLRFVVSDTVPDQIYRVQTINLYRAFNDDGTDELIPETNYKFVKAIDINSTNWTHETDLNIYYFAYVDNTTEVNISSVTFEENSGFSENTKSRYLNYKVHEWTSNKLHCANFYVDGTTYQNKIAKSQLNSPDVVPFVDTYDFDPYDGDEILNLTTAYSRIYAMKQRRTGIFFDDILERTMQRGIADIDSYFTDVDIIYLMNNEGFFELNGSQVRPLHDPVLTTFNAISTFTDATVFLRDDVDRVYFAVPGSKVLVWNRKHNVWTTYSLDYAFKGYFKNLENEYIGFGDNPNDSNEYFHVLDDDNQDDTNDISVSYESPLLRLDDLEGFHAELTQLYYRQKSTGTYTFTINDFRQDSKNTAVTFTITDVTTISTIVKHLTDAWGEAFSIEITGSGTVFQFDALTLQYVLAGLAEEMHT